MTTKTKGQDEPPIVRAAVDLQGALDEIETRTRRVVEQELRTAPDITRAGELLVKSEQAHRAFVAHLAALAEAVEDLRQRQNASARVCGERTELLDARRTLHDALGARFVAMGEGAREVNALVQGKTVAANGEGAQNALEDAEQRLAELVEEAGALLLDAKEAAFPELEKQAHAVGQQLAVMQRKIANVRS